MFLWSWGANSHGQLSHGIVSEQVQKPTKLSLDFKNGVKQLSCGGGHSLLLTKNGELYSCGWNHKLQLGNNKESHIFTRVWELSGINFVQIICGWDFSCGITDDQFLFVWGSNSYGQLGLPREHFDENVHPFRLHVNAKAVSMGLRHTVIINSKLEVWTTGCGKHGQLGLGKDILLSDKFQKVLHLGKISHIACGQNHTIAWCSEEKALYVWGDNKHRQLLLDPKKYKNIFQPEKIDIDVKQTVKKLLSGWTNVLLWLENGTIMTWGRNTYGQLGASNDFNGTIFHIKLPDNRQVKDVAVGSEHTVCLASDNTLWAWGWNEHGNTGTNAGECVHNPTLVPIELSSTEEIINVFCGGGHSFIATKINENIKNCNK